MTRQRQRSKKASRENVDEMARRGLAVEALRWHYEHREDAQRKAARGAAWILQHHSPAVQTSDLLAAMDDVEPREAKVARGRAWAVGYMPDTDHSPGVQALRKAVEPPAVVAVFGPERLVELLEQAGYAVTRSELGGSLTGGRVNLSPLYASLSSAQAVVLCMPSPMFPIRPNGNEWLGSFHEWERLLEQAGNELDTSTGTGGFNVAARAAYGGDHSKDWSLFVLVPGPKKRGVLVR